MASSPRSRLGTAALAVVCLGASFAAGMAVGRDGGPTGVAVAGGPLPVAGGPGALVRAGSCEELLDWYVDNTLDLVTPWGWNGPVTYYGTESGVLDRNLAVPTSPGRSSSDEVGSSETGTNVQEAGVDEPDVVKTDGEILVRVEGDDLTTYDVSGAAVRRLSRIDLPGSGRQASSELLLVGDQALVISQPAYGHSWPGSATEQPPVVVHRVDLSTPADPELGDSQEYDATLVSARQYGDTVQLVLGTGLPALDFVQPGDERTERQALRENRRLVRESAIEDWLPSVSDDGGDAELAVGCDAMTRPEDFSGGGSVVVVGYDAASPTERSALGVATSSNLVYSSPDRLYLATSQAWASCCVIAADVGRWGGPVGVPDRDAGTTELHAFELAGTSAEYVGSGQVEGAVADRWSMDAVDGTLRVAVGPTGETGNFNSVVTLRERDGALAEIGRVDRLGVNEEIKSVRWFDDLAIVVTFRQTDPLYAIDLSDPARPRRLGQLKIPGFSDYLHPIGEDQMIGIGSDATLGGRTRGGQAAVFDLTDPAQPRRLSKLNYGSRRTTLAGQDPRQFTWLPDRRTALTVVARWGSSGGMVGWVSVLEVGADGGLTNTMLPGTYGEADVAHLRTVPVPDGRVVLVTEDTARFLHW